MKRFDFVLNIPSPYRLHLLGEVYRQCTEKGIEFCAHFMSKGHAGRPASWRNPTISFPHKYWRDFGYKTHHFNPGLLLHLLLKPADIIYVGGPYDSFTTILAPFFVISKRGRTLVTGAEGNTKTLGKMGGFIGWFKRWCMSHWQYIAVPGTDAVKFIEIHQTMTKHKLPVPVIMPNIIDETRFVPKHTKSSVLICLIPARLEEVKGLVPFIELLRKEWLLNWRIVIMGQGHLKQTVLDKAAERGFLDKITILDYVPYSEMPAHYAAADLMLLPSLYDPNPLSVPEALHSGLAIALSDQAGNVEEGVTEGKNGWRLPVRDKNAFEMVLKDIFLSSAERIREMGAYSLSHNARFWNTQESIAKFLEGIGI